MIRLLPILPVLALLAACADPLAGLDRISDVDLAEAPPVAQALPTEGELAREGILDQPSGTGVENAPVAEVQTPPPAKGLRGFLRRIVPGQGAAALPPADAPAEDAAPEQAATDPVTPQDSAAAPVVLASLDPAPAPDLPDVAKPRRSGLLARILPKPAAPRSGVDAADVPYGTTLPYGVVARVCEARHKPLGRKVEKPPAWGYALYDSDPGAPGPRTFYITGFADDCPRQLTAANVLLGAPSLYEQLHYGPTGQHLVQGETDRAYEKIKAKVCGARRGKPCGGKIKQLERNTFFVNTYEGFGENARWSELLIHDGEILAAALKTNG